MVILCKYIIKAEQMIPNRDNVKYVVATEVAVSVEELTDEQIMKLNKPELQIGLKAVRKLVLNCRKEYVSLSRDVKNLDAMAMLLQNHGYDVKKK